MTEGENKMENKENTLSIVIGSWGSYNACNERSLGSSWICLNDFDTWEEIEEELTAQGFKLEGIDEELFIQDISEDLGFNCDYMHPKKLFNILKSSGVLDIAYKFKEMKAYIEIEGWDYFEEKVEEDKDCWDDDLYFYEDMTPEEVCEQEFENMRLDLGGLNWLLNYIDFKAMARDRYNLHEVSNGSIEI